MDDRLLFLLSKSHYKLMNYLRAQFNAQGIALSAGQIGILFLLDQKNLRSMSEISEVLEIDNSAVTRLVDRLEKAGLVSRRANPGDRRQYMIEITEQGREQAKKGKKIAKTANEKIKEGFTDDEIEIFKRVVAEIFLKFR